MRIHALTVCVDYEDHLALGFERWRSGLASWTIVTRPGGTERLQLFAGAGVLYHETDAFYRDGATFNKGRAMEEARLEMPWEDWILLIDADVVPPANWLDIVKAANPEPGWLHGAVRHDCEDPSNLDPMAWPVPKNDGIACGYFQLFHSSDPVVPKDRPFVPSDWKHAGGYDSELMDWWRQPGQPRRIRKIDTLHLTHVGGRDNWCGRGNDGAMRELLAARSRNTGFAHERLSGTEWKVGGVHG